MFRGEADDLREVVAFRRRSADARARALAAPDRRVRRFGSSLRASAGASFCSLLTTRVATASTRARSGDARDVGAVDHKRRRHDVSFLMAAPTARREVYSASRGPAQGRSHFGPIPARASSRRPSAARGGHVLLSRRAPGAHRGAHRPQLAAGPSRGRWNEDASTTSSRDRRRRLVVKRTRRAHGPIRNSDF